ncbi:MAG: c-type cytochrome [Burkholderiales bacterium]
MKFAPLILSVAAGAVFALPVQASEELAKKYMCLTCHQVDKKLVGPAFKEIAAKYASDKAAEGKMVDKVKKGGAGVWGQIPMPPNDKVPEADLKAVVKWVLSAK